MRDFGQYILGVGLAALLVAVIIEFADRKSSTGIITRMICGLFLAFTVISPLADLNYGILEVFAKNMDQEAQPIVSAGTALAEESIRQIIKEETEAYILDKARSMDCILEVDVTVREGEYPIPESVILTGYVLPQKQKQLENFLEQDLGLSKEKQQWIG